MGFFKSELGHAFFYIVGNLVTGLFGYAGLVLHVDSKGQAVCAEKCAYVTGIVPDARAVCRVGSVAVYVEQRFAEDSPQHGFAHGHLESGR